MLLRFHAELLTYGLYKLNVYRFVSQQTFYHSIKTYLSLQKFFTLFLLQIVSFSMCNRSHSKSDKARPISQPFPPQLAIHGNGFQSWRFSITFGHSAFKFSPPRNVHSSRTNKYPSRHFDNCITPFKTQPTACIMAHGSRGVMRQVAVMFSGIYLLHSVGLFLQP